MIVFWTVWGAKFVREALGAAVQSKRVDPRHEYVVFVLKNGGWIPTPAMISTAKNHGVSVELVNDAPMPNKALFDSQRLMMGAHIGESCLYLDSDAFLVRPVNLTPGCVALHTFCMTPTNFSDRQNIHLAMDVIGMTPSVSARGNCVTRTYKPMLKPMCWRPNMGVMLFSAGFTMKMANDHLALCRVVAMHCQMFGVGEAVLAYMSAVQPGFHEIYPETTINRFPNLLVSIEVDSDGVARCNDIGDAIMHPPCWFPFKLWMEDDGRVVGENKTKPCMSPDGRTENIRCIRPQESC